MGIFKNKMDKFVRIEVNLTQTWVLEETREFFRDPCLVSTGDQVKPVLFVERAPGNTSASGGRYVTSGPLVGDSEQALFILLDSFNQSVVTET